MRRQWSIHFDTFDVSTVNSCNLTFLSVIRYSKSLRETDSTSERERDGECKSNNNSSNESTLAVSTTTATQINVVSLQWKDHQVLKKKTQLSSSFFHFFSFSPLMCVFVWLCFVISCWKLCHAKMTFTKSYYNTRDSRIIYYSLKYVNKSLFFLFPRLFVDLSI